MPWANVPKEKWPAMERCTSDLKKDPKFKPLKGKTKEESIVAVCYSSIIGNKRKGGEKMEKPPVTINFYGNYWDKISEENEVIENIEKKGGEEDSMEKEKCPECGKMVEKDKMKAHMAEKHPAKKLDDAKEEKPVEAPVEPEKPAEVPVEEKKEEPVVEEKVEEKVEKKSAEPEQTGEVTELLKSMIAKIDSLTKKEEKVKKADDSAPAVGTTPEGEKAPKEEEAEAPKEGEEAKPEGEKPEGESQEGAEKEGEKIEKAENFAVAELAKINSSLSKFDQSLSKIGDQLKSFEERLTKIEEQPAPVKVASPVTVSKGSEVSKLSDDDEKRLTEIKKELDDLDYERKHNLEEYQKGSKWNKAYSLMDERDALLAKK